MDDEGYLRSGSIQETQEEFQWFKVELVKVRGETHLLGKSLGQVWKETDLGRT